MSCRIRNRARAGHPGAAGRAARRCSPDLLPARPAHPIVTDLVTLVQVAAVLRLAGKTTCGTAVYRGVVAPGEVRLRGGKPPEQLVLLKRLEAPTSVGDAPDRIRPPSAS